MTFQENGPVPCFITRKGMLELSENLMNAQVIRSSLFKKLNDDGTVACHFDITWLQFPNGQVIPTVARADLLPLLDEVLDALRSFNG